MRRQAHAYPLLFSETPVPSSLQRHQAVYIPKPCLARGALLADESIDARPQFLQLLPVVMYRMRGLQMLITFFSGWAGLQKLITDLVMKNGYKWGV